MQRPGKRGRSARLVDMSIAPAEFEYRRPRTAEKVLDQLIVIDADAPCQLYVVAWEYRKLIVDFAYTLKATEIEDPTGGSDHVARVDCCHQKVHSHQFFRDGQHYKSGEKEILRDLVYIQNQETAWQLIDTAYDECLDDLFERWDQYYRRWSTNGRSD